MSCAYRPPTEASSSAGRVVDLPRRMLLSIRAFHCRSQRFGPGRGVQNVPLPHFPFATPRGDATQPAHDLVLLCVSAFGRRSASVDMDTKRPTGPRLCHAVLCCASCPQGTRRIRGDGIVHSTAEHSIQRLGYLVISPNQPTRRYDPQVYRLRRATSCSRRVVHDEDPGSSNGPASLARLGLRRVGQCTNATLGTNPGRLAGNVHTALSNTRLVIRHESNLVNALFCFGLYRGSSMLGSNTAF
jgi:hypothetical protein